MQSSITVVKPAGDISLVSLREAKIGLKIASTADDELIEQIIEFASGLAATLCNRVFAQETVIETFRDVGDASRLYLSRWPVKEITSLTCDGDEWVVDTDFDVDFNSGRLNAFSSTYWGTEPISVAYTGGYKLPFEAPKALKQATILLARESYYAAQRGDQSVRMISHKDSRIIYFDPNLANRAAVGQGAAGGSPAERAIGNLLKHFMRIEV